MRVKLKLFRVAQNLTQEQMAEKIGCQRSTYSAIEKGLRSGRQDFWKAFQFAFAIPDEEIWQYTKNESE